jgi:Protein of unknown function (DUF2970)
MSDAVLRPRASLLRTVKAVLWSFVGLRQAEASRQDAQSLNPVHVVLVGIAICLVFVVALICFAQWAVKAAA